MWYSCDGNESHSRITRRTLTHLAHRCVLRHPTLPADAPSLGPRAPQGQTPLISAANNGRTAVVEALLAAGADKDKADKDVSGVDADVVYLRWK